MTRAILENDYVLAALRVGLGAMFILAAWDKVLDPAAFSIAVDNYHMVPRVFLHFFTLALPMTELAVGLMLIAGVWTRAAALISAVLMVMFVIGLAQALLRGLDIACGCFTQDTGQESKISPLLLVRDTALIFGSLWVALFDRGRWSVLNLFGRSGTVEAPNT
jgi:uncharacterized membrane protein YphA (DoxX/SURF4 family)